MLEYGFATEQSSAEVRAKTAVWCNAFNKIELDLFHQIIPFMCMSTGIGRLYGETIPVLVERLNVTDPEWIPQVCGYLHLDKAKASEAFTTWLNEKLVGFFTNCGFDTHREWQSRWTRNLPNADPNAKDDKIRFKMRAAYITKVTSRLSKRWYSGFDEAYKHRLADTVVEEVAVPVLVEV